MRSLLPLLFGLALHLTAAAQTNSVFFHGIRHDAVGQATLSIDLVNDPPTLRVANLESPGSGFRQEFGSAQGIRFGWDPGFVTRGGTLHKKLDSDGLIGPKTITAFQIGGGGSLGYVLEGLVGPAFEWVRPCPSHCVEAVQLPGVGMLAEFSDPPISFECNMLAVDGSDPGTTQPVITFKFYRPATVSIGGGAPVTTDVISIALGYVAEPLVGVELLATAATQGDVLELNDASLLQANHWLRGVGGAELIAGDPLQSQCNGALRISNIGSSGQDGVRIELAEGENDIRLPQPTDNVNEDGDMFQFVTLESAGPGPSATNGGIRLTIQGANFGVDAAGAVPSAMQLLNDGQLILEVSGFSGGVAAQGPGAAWMFEGCYKYELTALCTSVHWPAAVPHSVPGLGTFSADEVLFRYDGVLDPNPSCILSSVKTNPPQMVRLSGIPNGLSPLPPSALPEMTATGGATLAAVHKYDHLAIQNIGCSADDGVEVKEGGANSWTHKIRLPAVIPSGGAALTILGRNFGSPTVTGGEVVGAGASTSGSLPFTIVGRGFDPAPSLLMRLRDHGAVVAEFPVPDGVPAVEADFAPIAAGAGRVDDTNTRAWFEFPEDTPMTLLLGPTGMKMNKADIIEVITDSNGAIQDTPIDVALRFEDLDWIVIEGSAAGYPTATPPSALLRSRLLPAAPNPFNPRTALRFVLERDGPAQLRVFDLRGRLVSVLLDRPMTAGPHSLVWNGRDLRGRAVASGSYRVELRDASGARSTQSVVLVR